MDHSVRAVQFDEEKIISGGDDGKIKIFNLESGVFSLDAHHGNLIDFGRC